MRRIARVLISLEWLSEWNNFSLWALNRDVSDHCPLMFRSKSQNLGAKPFRVQNSWLREKNFSEMVDKKCKKCEVLGWGAFVLKEKMKNLKGDIKTWVEENVGDLD
jgi:hypothetical protein